MNLRDQLQSSLGHVYTVERELGGGGMSRVFLVQERALGRQVVIKVLPPDVAGELSVERFTREIQTAARLQHPLIVPLLSAGEADGILYYTMPMVQGESLRERLTRTGRVPAADVMRIGNDVAGALAYAHEQGVVHRDIKPENILLSGGHAVILDFGIARALDMSRVVSGASLTQAGVSIGTPMYMSPEQAASDSMIDGRSDIYSLGAVLYELLAGRPPFTGATTAAVIAKRFVEKPPLLRTIDHEIPAHLERAVARAMELEPDDRFASGAQMSEAMRDIALVPEVRIDRSIAVLPFANTSGDAESEYFSDGMTEELINVLARVPGLRVASRTSSFGFKGSHADIGEIGSKLKVSAVLEGSVRRAGSRLRITAQLFDVAHGQHLWSERFDREMADVFVVQDEIARAIAQELEMTLAVVGGKALVRPATRNLEAYDLYLRGRYFSAKRGLWLKKARAYFERAVALDPSYALAQAGLADSHSLLALYGYVPSIEAREPARAASARAIALDERCAEAHTAAGMYELFMGWNLERGAAEFRRAIELSPNVGITRAWLANLLPLLDCNAEAQHLARRSMQLEPLSPLVGILATLTFVEIEAWQEASEALERSLELEPLPPGYLLAGLFHQREGRFDEAVASMERGAEMSERSPFIISFLGGALARAGRQADARAILDELASANADACFRAIVHWHLGDEAAAFALIEHGLQVHDCNMLTQVRMPGLEKMRADSRWATALQRAGLPAV